MSKPDVVGGLTVVSLRGEGKLWYVEHAGSGIALFSGGFLRQRRFAEEARSDFLATGVDFTRTRAELSGKLAPMHEVYTLWYRRARQDEIDLVTGEHYSSSTHYGQHIPSAARARELAEMFACYLWS